MTRQKFEPRRMLLRGQEQVDRAAEVTPEMKVCTKCRADKPFLEFSKNKKNKDGLKYQCKSCDRVEIAAYRIKFPEKAIAAHADYYQRNSVAIRERHKQTYWTDPTKFRRATLDWYEKNKDRVLVRARNYRQQNSEKLAEAMRKWRTANRDAIKAYGKRYASANKGAMRVRWTLRRARKRNAEGVHTANDIARILVAQKFKCACCRIGIRRRYHADHIFPLARGGSNLKENIQLLCPTCNLKKGAKDPVTFMQSIGYLL